MASEYGEYNGCGDYSEHSMVCIVSMVYRVSEYSECTKLLCPFFIF